MHPRAHTLSWEIRQHAMELGFQACGFARAALLEDKKQQYYSWLEKGFHATMGYMERNIEKRLDPTLLVENAKSVIVLAHNYFPSQLQHPQAHYRISKYAFGVDYHFVIKKKLFSLLDFIRSRAGQQVQARVFTDSAPVLERAWAVRAGLGNTGKNACLILPKKGSFYFLSEIILDVELEYSQPFTRDLCGKCTRCIDACPTGAITGPGVIDASRCISYLTIESKEDIPETFSGKCHNWIFGCDICQDVCPHNRFPTPHQEPGLDPLPYTGWDREKWEAMTKQTWKAEIKDSGSPLSRAGFEKLKSNISFSRK